MPQQVKELNGYHTLTTHRRPMTVIPKPVLRTRLLLAEGCAESDSSRNLLLSASGFRVERASTRSEIFELRLIAIHLAVLSDSLGALILRGVAEDVRRQWPLARVLIIGRAEAVLDDPLYDEAVDRRASPSDLLLVLARMSIYPFSQRVEVWSVNPESADHQDEIKHNRTSMPAESDPTKAPGNDSGLRVVPRDLPAEERRNWRHIEPFQQTAGD
jgi:hypothetical protein